MKKLTALILAVVICIPFVSCTLPNQDKGEEYVIVDITVDNYKDYIDFKLTDTAIDAQGNPIEGSCVVVSSKVFDDGLYFLSASDVKFNISGGSYGIGGALGAPYGLIIEDAIPGNIVIHDMSGTYKFVKSEYVEEYVFEDGIRRITMKDGRYQEINFEGCAIDYSNPY